MIRMFQSQTSAHAKNYFKASLSRADYYIETQEHPGFFHGKVAKRLGLENMQVDQGIFDKLCDNINPKNGESLTPRTVDDRRVGYDISFHCPKSVSILHALGDDDRILQSFKESVDETMLDMQEDMQTRIRTQGQYADRDTGELIWADFVHETARPVEGHAPDPHLHCHCFVFNTTWDDTEQRFKAGQFHNIKRDMPYYQARFQKRLADKLSGFGYDIRKSGRDYDLAMIPQEAINHFSKRTNHIGQIAKEKKITDPRELDKIGARSRARKQKNLTMDDLRKAWRKQLKDANINDKTKSERATILASLQPRDCIDYSLDHCFSRASVKRERQLLTEAYLHAIDNKTVSMAEIDKVLSHDERIFAIKDGNQSLCTTALVLEEERRMVHLAQKGLSQLRPLKPTRPDHVYDNLSHEQGKAVNHILNSSDRLTMIRGGAGTGKTTLIKSAVKEIEQTGKTVFMYAPTSDAARRTLRDEGFENADTVASLLKNAHLQEQLEHQVIWVDEAGMLGTEDMVDILELATEKNARLILSGDPRQHTAVQRGDAMRILQQVGRTPYVSLETIHRQKVNTYKETVEAIGRGDLQTGFQRLECMGSLEELNPEDITGKLVDDYVNTVKQKKSALIISPTNEQAAKVTSAVRKNLKQSGLLSKYDKQFITYRNLHLTNAQKSDKRMYRKGQVIQLHQNIPGAVRGSKLEVFEASEKGIFAKDTKGKELVLPYDRSKDFDVYVPKTTDLAKGDKIRVTKNGTDMEGRRIDNGWILDVKGFTPDGDIKVTKQSKTRASTYVLEREHGNFNHAYCLTSYGAQGKTVDKVFIAQPVATFPATSQKQFYVSISRAREEIKIYTDDKEGLLFHAEKTGDRTSAMELQNGQSWQLEIDAATIFEHKSPKDISNDKEPEI